MQSQLRWFLASCLASLAACAPVHFTHQELLVRHAPEKDTLDVCLIYREITASDGTADRLAEAYRFTSAVARGERELLVFDWPFHLDLDKFAAETIEPGPWADWKRERNACLPSMSIRSAGLFTEPSGNLSIYQVLHIEHAQRVIALLNAALHNWIRQIDDAELIADTPAFDQPTRELWRKLGNDRTPWLFLRDGALEVDLPLSPACAAMVLRGLVAESGSGSDFAKFVGFVLEPLAKLEVSENHVRSTFAPKDGLLRRELAMATDQDPALRERVARMGPAPDPKLDLASVRKLVEKP